MRITFTLFLLALTGCSEMKSDGTRIEESVRPLTSSEEDRLEEHRSRLWADPEASERMIHDRYHNMLFGRGINASIDDRFTLGVALGDVIHAKSEMNWCTAEFDGERHFAIHYPGTSILVFPIAMIDKRVDAGEPINLKSLGESTIATAEEMAKDPEYQRPK